MNQKRILFTALAIVILVGACAPAPAPTQDPALVQQLIEQAVELTVAAQNAQATEQQALIVPSNTPLPTQTEVVVFTPTPILPTATPFVIVPPTNTVVVSSGGGGGSVPAPKPDYACAVSNRIPYDNTYYTRNKHIDIKWTITNTGTKTIRKGADVKYYSGPEIMTVDRVELPELKPGESFVVDLDAKAPEKKGFTVVTWVVEGGLCFPYLAIIVE